MSLIDIVEFHSLLPGALESEPVVLDLGANRGRFSKKMQDRFGARCVAVEANPHLMHDLRKKVPGGYNLAILDHVGEIDLAVSKNALASTVKNEAAASRDSQFDSMVSVSCMDLESFVQHAGLDRIDLLKVDIEGAEIDMFRACSGDFLQRIPQITVEFHDFCGLTPAAVVAECLDRFHRLGFASIRFSRVGHQDVLLLNRKLVPISDASLLWAKYGYRNVKGLARMIRKRVYGKRWSDGYS